MLKYSDSIINVVKLRSRALIYCGRTTLRMSYFPWSYSMDIEVSMTYSHYCLEHYMKVFLVKIELKFWY